MKRFIALLAAAAFLVVGVFAKPVHVKGYTKKDGTYVAPHYRSSPNSTKSDNYSTKGNVNPYTGKEGSKPDDGQASEPQKNATGTTQPNAPSVTEPQKPTPSAPSTAPAEKSYWITVKSGVRHNSKCRYYQNSNGRPCTKDEGRACKLCGG